MRPSVVVTVLVVGVLGLAGCTGGGDPKPSGSGSAAAAGGSGGAVQQAGTVVEGTFPVPGDTDHTVRVEVEPLVVQDKTMELRVWFTPDEELADGGSVNIYGMTGEGDLLPALNDLEHLTQYFVLSETGQQWETDVVRAEAAGGEPVLYQAWFAAPTERVESLDLSLVASWAPFEDVPVTYED